MQTLICMGDKCINVTVNSLSDLCFVYAMWFFGIFTELARAHTLFTKHCRQLDHTMCSGEASDLGEA